MSQRHPAIPPDHRLRDCPSQSISLAWPAPVNQRLDELVALARDAARDTNRKELVAALLLAAPTDPVELDEIIRRYRLASARDALIEPEAVEEGNLFLLPKHGPGPR